MEAGGRLAAAERMGPAIKHGSTVRIVLGIAAILPIAFLLVWIIRLKKTRISKERSNPESFT